MSQASLPQSIRSHIRNTSDETVVDDQETVDALFDMLDDEGCRCILEATDETALSASEISEVCDLPLSTTYRKLEPLTETGLLSKSLRISRSGKHTAEYTRAVDDVTVSVSSSGLEVRITHLDASQESTVTA
ncbi:MULTISPECIES: helix-turn-helix domain-containing protein [Haloferax]|uniref:Helix-turn-helix domain-containing protein n=1 Tax=Haloferax marinum TaxID=2666143 RepID=A0A6A8G671_9EURY|nr:MULTISPECIES: helix-turn-helix domain-containing protein [Haloferax]KAB1197269.1 helix-turn-helix transcriptional regulator [Haloferax sp. CBA1150]MRW96307.1 helix-turn-helix domain-containing protein [Haloferax marinum]